MDLRFNSTGTDAQYLAHTNMFFSTLFDLSVFKTRWAEDKLGSQSALQSSLDWYRQMFEGGLTGNRLHIAARKTARNELDARIQKILYYVAVMADESDLALLLNSNVVTQKSRKRARKISKPLATN